MRLPSAVAGALENAAAVLGISLETLVNQIDTRFHGRESDKTRNASSDGRRAGQELCSSIKRTEEWLNSTRELRWRVFRASSEIDGDNLCNLPKE